MQKLPPPPEPPAKAGFSGAGIEPSLIAPFPPPADVIVENIELEPLALPEPPLLLLLEKMLL